MQKLECLPKKLCAIHEGFFSALLVQREVLILRKGVTPVSQADCIVPLSTLSTIPIAINTALVGESGNLYKPVQFFSR